MTTYSASFRPLSGGEGSYPLTHAIYRCPNTGELLDVAHDLDALATRGAAQWKELFDERLRHRVGILGSGVWSKREWVVPDLPDEAIVTLGEGNGALIPAERHGASIGVADLWIKMCGNSHTGSFKDLGMTVLVSVVKHAIRQGAAIAAIGCASTGDTSAALAAYGAAAGIPVVVLLPRGKISTAQLVQPLASGATVLSLDTDFDGCMALIDRLAADGVLYLANSMNALRIEGQKTVAIEICQAFGWAPPDWIVLPAGNLGNGYAMYRGLAMMKHLGLIDRLPRLALAQAENANPLYRAFAAGNAEVEAVAARTTLASAIQIGNPVSAPRALRALAATGGVVEQASENELCDAAARADRSGLYVCPHTAVALTATEKLARRGVIAAGERVVVVSTASGLKFTEFKVRYHEAALGGAGVTSAHANQPLELPADYARVRDTISSLR